MKQVKYIGATPADLPSLGLYVQNGDVITVNDDFSNSKFVSVPTKPVKKITESVDDVKPDSTADETTVDELKTE